MKKILFKTILCSLIIGCSYEQGPICVDIDADCAHCIAPNCEDVDGIEVWHHKTERMTKSIIPQLGENFTGTVKGCYGNGKLAVQEHYVNGQYHGIKRLWFLNGQLMHSSNYSNGEIEGEHRNYHLNGRLSSVSNYINGQLNGKQVQYGQDGDPYVFGSFTNGRRDGDWRYRDSRGYIVYTYENGELISCDPPENCVYDDYGRLKKANEYKN